MYENKSTAVKNFGYDNETSVDYRFNSLGYRSNVEFTPDSSAIVLLGNSISFGIGLPLEQTYGEILSQKTGRPVYNFSLGCYGHTNMEQLPLLESILRTFDPFCVIFQINNLNRFRLNGKILFDNPIDRVISEYNNFYKDVKILLKDMSHIFLYWDQETFDVKLPDCLIHNKYHVDYSLKNRTSTFGKKTNKLIAEKIFCKISYQ